MELSQCFMEKSHLFSMTDEDILEDSQSLSARYRNQCEIIFNPNTKKKEQKCEIEKSSYLLIH